MEESPLCARLRPLFEQTPRSKSFADLLERATCAQALILQDALHAGPPSQIVCHLFDLRGPQSWRWQLLRVLAHGCLALALPARSPSLALLLTSDTYPYSGFAWLYRTLARELQCVAARTARTSTPELQELLCRKAIRRLETRLQVQFQAFQDATPEAARLGHTYEVALREAVSVRPSCSGARKRSFGESFVSGGLHLVFASPIHLSSLVSDDACLVACTRGCSRGAVPLALVAASPLSPALTAWQLTTLTRIPYQPRLNHT